MNVSTNAKSYSRDKGYLSSGKIIGSQNTSRLSASKGQELSTMTTLMIGLVSFAIDLDSFLSLILSE